jgi:hypothetical protein
MADAQNEQNVRSYYFIPNVSPRFIDCLTESGVAWSPHTSPIHETGVLVNKNARQLLDSLGLVMLSDKTFPQSIIDNVAEEHVITNASESDEQAPSKPKNSQVHRVVLLDPRPIEEIQRQGAYFIPPPIDTGNEKLIAELGTIGPLLKVIREEIAPALNIKVKLFFVNGEQEHLASEYFSINILGVRWRKEDPKLVVPETIWDIPTGGANGTPCYAPQGGELIIFSEQILPLAAVDNNQHLYIHFNIAKVDGDYAGDLMRKIFDRVRLGVVDPKAYEKWIRETLYDESFRQYLLFRVTHRAHRVESAYRDLLKADYSHMELLLKLRDLEASLNENEILIKVHRRQSETLRAKLEADLPKVRQIPNLDQIKAHPGSGTLVIFLKDIIRQDRLLGNFAIYLFQPFSTRPWIKVFNLKPVTRPVIGTTHAPNILANGSFVDPKFVTSLLRSLDTNGLSALVEHIIKYLSVGNPGSTEELELLQFFPQVDHTAAINS